MKRFVTMWVVLLGLALVVGPHVNAKEHGNGNGKGKDKEKDKEDAKDGEKRPPGWDKGKKKGWKSDVPPGWDKMSDDDKDKWTKKLDNAKEEVHKRATEKGLKDEDRERAKDVVEIAARRGKDADLIKKQVQDAIDKGRSVLEVLKDNDIEIHIGD